MGDLARQLEDARAQVARLEQQALSATCAELGHDWRHIGGRNCGCEFGDGGRGNCSIPVYECARCRDCDYGDNDEANGKKASCAAAELTP